MNEIKIHYDHELENHCRRMAAYEAGLKRGKEAVCERIVERLGALTKKHMGISEKAAELGRDYEKHVILNGAKGMAYEHAIDIVKEEGGLNEVR